MGETTTMNATGETDTTMPIEATEASTSESEEETTLVITEEIPTTRENSDLERDEELVSVGVNNNDGSRIVFSDDELNKRNEILATRRNEFPRFKPTSEAPERKDDKSSRIFFPES